MVPPISTGVSKTPYIGLRQEIYLYVESMCYGEYKAKLPDLPLKLSDMEGVWSSAGLFPATGPAKRFGRQMKSKCSTRIYMEFRIGGSSTASRWGRWALLELT